MYERILIPLDGSSLAEIVLPYAEELSVKFGAELILASVSEPEVPEVNPVYRSYLEDLAEKVQRQLSARGTEKKAWVSIEVLMGKPATEILQYADVNNVGLIAMARRGGSHGGPGEGKWLLGNIASKVLQAADNPILLIRVAASSAALQQKRLFKKILVPLDGSEMAEAVVPYIEALARPLNAQVILFHVLELAPVPVLLAPGIQFPFPPVTPEQEARRAVSGLAYLEGVEKALTEKGIYCSSETSSGSPAVEILNYAEANAIDLIAMSTHGRSGIGRWVFGSVTEKLLQTGSTPILTIRGTRG
jgi:nucleotide-binding universal stress UspA family protein